MLNLIQFYRLEKPNHELICFNVDVINLADDAFNDYITGIVRTSKNLSNDKRTCYFNIYEMNYHDGIVKHCKIAYIENGNLYTH